MAANSIPPKERHQLPTTVLTAAMVSQALRLEALERAGLTDLEEPECSCFTSGDLFDPRNCEAHNLNSPWNVAQRAITALERYEVYEPVEAQECPF